MKKKIVAIILSLLMVLGLCACGEKTENSNNSNTEVEQSGTHNNTEQEKDAGNVSSNGKITMEKLLKAPESKESDFFCSEGENGEYILHQYNGSDEIVVIPETINGKAVTNISKYTFANDCSVKAIKLSDSIKKLEGYCFALNNNLEIVYCGASLETIGEFSFMSCVNLREVRLNEGLKEVHTYAFSMCDSLEKVEVPDSVETIELLGFGMNNNITLIGKAGSAVQTYAESEKIKFQAK